jgi:hypothetical protein
MYVRIAKDAVGNEAYYVLLGNFFVKVSQVLEIPCSISWKHNIHTHMLQY